MTQVGQRITEDQFNIIVAPFQLDMVALFNLMLEDAVMKLTDAEKDGKTPEEFIQSVQDIFSD